jgi:hypothetical protein
MTPTIRAEIMSYWTMTLYWSTVMVFEHAGVGRQPT